jgi:hypothetical protein
VTVEAVERLEAVGPDGPPEGLRATTGRDLVRDLAAVLSFALNAVFLPDRDAVRALVPPVRRGRPGWRAGVVSCRRPRRAAWRAGRRRAIRCDVHSTGRRT